MTETIVPLCLLFVLTVKGSNMTYVYELSFIPIAYDSLTMWWIIPSEKEVV